MGKRRDDVSPKGSAGVVAEESAPSTRPRRDSSEAQGPAEPAASRLFFPLRTGVELFEDRTSPEAVTRAKQAAVLYDKLIFEAGLCEVSVTPQGSWDQWIPPHFLPDERLEDSRRVHAPGTPFRLAFGQEGSDQMVEFINAPLKAEYVSEYHTGILDELAVFEPDWVEQVSTGTRKLPPDTSEGRLMRTLSRRDRRDRALMPGKKDENNFLRSWIIESFNRDAVLASSMGASFNLTSLFAPMLERRGMRPERAGFAALNIAVPNLGSLPWEAVLNFRAHPGSEEARARLREFEEKAAHEEPEDAYAFLNRVAQEATGALFAAAEDLRSGWPERIAREVAKTSVSLDPTYGLFAGIAATGTEMLSDALKGRRSWMAALMVLRRRG